MYPPVHTSSVAHRLPAGMSSSGKKVKWGGKDALIAKATVAAATKKSKMEAKSTVQPEIVIMYDRFVPPSPRAGELKDNMKAVVTVPPDSPGGWATVANAGRLYDLCTVKGLNANPKKSRIFYKGKEEDVTAYPENVRAIVPTLVGWVFILASASHIDELEAVVVAQFGGSQPGVEQNPLSPVTPAPARQYAAAHLTSVRACPRRAALKAPIEKSIYPTDADLPVTVVVFDKAAKAMINGAIASFAMALCDGFALKVLRTMIEELPSWEYNNTIVLSDMTTGTIGTYATLDTKKVGELVEMLKVFGIEAKVEHG